MAAPFDTLAASDALEATGMVAPAGPAVAAFALLP